MVYFYKHLLILLFSISMLSCTMQVSRNLNDEDIDVPDGGGDITGSAPDTGAENLYFADKDPNEDVLSGDILISKATDESKIKSYVIYWGSDSNTKLGDPIATISATGSDISFTIPDSTALPLGALYILVYTQNENGEYNVPVALDIPDLVVELASNVPMEDRTNRQHGMVRFNDKLYYAANDGVNGIELWSFDGTNATMVADSCPGACDSYPMWITKFNDKLYYMGGDGVNGRELWVYDGVNPPYMLADIAPGAGNSVPSHFVVFNDELYFNAADTGFDYELWKYDEIDPPRKVADIRVGLSGSNPYGLTVFNNKLYFSAESSAVNRELWVYDGVNPPSMVHDICVGGSSGPGDIYGGGLVELSGKIYFRANDCINGIELWSYDGVNPPEMVQDLSFGAFSSTPDDLTVLNNKLYFSAVSIDAAGNSEYGTELYRYDPATDTINMEVDIAAGAADSGLAHLETLSNYFLFTATDGISGGEPFIYDGRTAYRLFDLEPGAGSSLVSDFITMNGKLYFNGGSKGLWVAYIK